MDFPVVIMSLLSDVHNLRMNVLALPRFRSSSEMQTTYPTDLDVGYEETIDDVGTWSIYVIRH